MKYRIYTFEGFGKLTNLWWSKTLPEGARKMMENRDIWVVKINSSSWHKICLDDTAISFGTNVFDLNQLKEYHEKRGRMGRMIDCPECGSKLERADSPEGDIPYCNQCNWTAL